MKKLTIGISALALAIAGIGIAAEMPSGPDDSREITRVEAKAEAEKQFDRMDVNHDGKLDKADHAAMRDQHFDHMDTNHDGSLSRSEFDTPPTPPAGPNGGPDAGMAPPHGDHDGQRGEHMGEHMRGHKGGGHMGMAMMVMHKADPNHTGNVTKTAFVDAALSMFDGADTNHDGKLTKAEREAAHKKMRDEMKARWGEHGGERHGEHGGEHHGEHGGMGDDMPPMDPMK